MTHAEAIAEGQRIVADRGKTVFTVDQCAKVIAALLPGEILLAEAATQARHNKLCLMYNRDCGLIAAGMENTDGWDGWTRVRLGEKS
jgi:hypothetical protein